uniref:Uncharacterized protein n=1 Tax=Ananas comosus var. bracteatus TaxID=296719 RepID=A0A6V7PZ37_ANACO|nr:unnamed protein product [Ananas comosus var. bracteatus]
MLAKRLRTISIPSGLISSSLSPLPPSSLETFPSSHLEHYSFSQETDATSVQVGTPGCDTSIGIFVEKEGCRPCTALLRRWSSEDEEHLHPRQLDFLLPSAFAVFFIRNFHVFTPGASLFQVGQGRRIISIPSGSISFSPSSSAVFFVGNFPVFAPGAPLFQEEFCGQPPGDASWGGSGNIGRPTECGVCWWCTRTARAGEARPLVALEVAEAMAKYIILGVDCFCLTIPTALWIDMLNLATVHVRSLH